MDGQAWFEQNSPDGDTIWKRLSYSLKIVVARPNSWSLNEQSALKRSIKRSGILRGGGPVERVPVFSRDQRSHVDD